MGVGGGGVKKGPHSSSGCVRLRACTLGSPHKAHSSWLSCRGGKHAPAPPAARRACRPPARSRRRHNQTLGALPCAWGGRERAGFPVSDGGSSWQQVPMRLFRTGMAGAGYLRRGREAKLARWAMLQTRVQAARAQRSREAALERRQRQRGRGSPFGPSCSICLCRSEPPTVPMVTSCRRSWQCH